MGTGAAREGSLALRGTGGATCLSLSIGFGGGFGVLRPAMGALEVEGVECDLEMRPLVKHERSIGSGRLNGTCRVSEMVSITKEERPSWLDQQSHQRLHKPEQGRR
jgi:hypothetical protein